MSKNTKRITFGNIMVTLLVLGTFTVIGLLGKLYIELTKTPDNTAARQQQQQQQQQTQLISPDAKKKPEYNNDNQNASAAVATNNPRVQAAQPTTVSSMAMASEPSNINTMPLTTSANKKPQTPKKVTTPSRDENTQANGNLSGEVPLQPTNAPAPRANNSNSGERKLVPVASGNNNPSERVLQPQPAPRSAPQKNHDDPTDALF